MGINTEAGVREERVVFWHWVGGVTTAFNLSITVMSLGVTTETPMSPYFPLAEYIKPVNNYGVQATLSTTVC